MANPVSNKQALWAKVAHIMDDHGQRNVLLPVDTTNYILRTRESEKRELNELNNILDAFMQRVGRLSGANQRIQEITGNVEQDILNIKTESESETRAIQQRLDEAVRLKSHLETQHARLLSDTEEWQNKLDLSVVGGNNVDELERRIRETGDKLKQLEAEAQKLQDEINRLKNENTSLEHQLQQAKADLDRERLKTLELNNHVDILQSKNEFIRKEKFVIDQVLPQPRRPSGGGRVVDCRDIARDIGGIRAEFDQWSNENRIELQDLRNIKMNEIYATERLAHQEKRKCLDGEIAKYTDILRQKKTENETLQKEFNDLQNLLVAERDRHESTVRELNERIAKLYEENILLQKSLKVLVNANHTLKAEIAIYRKMVGGRTPNLPPRNIPPPLPLSPLRPPVSPITPGPGGVHIVKEEITARTPTTRTFSDSSNVHFGDVALDGKYITLDNKSQFEVDMGSWKLTRYINNNEQPSFKFLPTFRLNERSSVKIWNRSQGAHEHICEGNLWDDPSSTVKCVLLDKDGKEMATYVRDPTKIDKHSVNLI